MARPVYGPEFAGGFRAVFEALCSAWASTCFSRVRRTPKSSGHRATPGTKGNRWNRRSLLIHRHTTKRASKSSTPRVSWMRRRAEGDGLRSQLNSWDASVCFGGMDI